jgi:hypothetical protein
MARVHRLTVLFGLLSVMAAGAPAGARTQETPKKDQGTKTQEAPSKKDFSVMDAGAGPCSVELTVTDADGKPVSAALINVHIAYGFAGVRKLDLSVYTNDQGKAKFTGLPYKVHKPPVEFHASKDQATGTAIYDPGAEGECQAKHNIELRKPKTDTDPKSLQE